MSNSTWLSTKAKDRQNTKNRRRMPRLDATALPFLKSVNQVGGPEVKLINISRRGALIESQVRLTTGSSICLRLAIAETVYLLKGRVLRYSVSSLVGSSLRYQSAIVFDEDFAIMPESTEAEEIQIEPAESTPADSNDSAVTIFNSDSSAKVNEDLEIITVNNSAFCDNSELRKSLKINNWLAP